MTDPANTALARKFLRRVWGEQLAHLRKRDLLPAHAFLSQKHPDGTWTDRPTELTNTPRLRLPTDTDNLYYAVNLFINPRRLKRFVPGGCWLYADLDEVDPRTLDTPTHDLRPTLAIESSPGRYQGLWLLDRWLNTRRLSELNQQLTYFTAADKGNWKMTQVLRVPGTISTKHATPFTVRLMWAKPSTLHYKPSDVRAIVGAVETPQSASNTHSLVLPRVSAQRLLARYSSRLPVEAKKLARTKTVLASEDRSSRLWRLECLLLEAGMKPEEVFVVIKPTPWNKWADTPDQGTAQLWTEINKAQQHVKRNATSKPSTGTSNKRGTRNSGKEGSTSSPSKGTPTKPKKKDTRRTLVDINDFLLTRLPKPSWLVEGIWGKSAHGLLAGEAKTYKSLLTMDQAVSVASGTPFLNKFQIPRAGPVLLIQEENDASDMHDRLMRIMSSRGFAPRAHTSKGRLHFDSGTSLPIKMLNRQGFQLSDDDDLEYLDRWCTQIKPALVILDPLYLMCPGLNTSEAGDMTPLLSNLLKLKQAHGCGIQLVHHFRKPTANDGKRAAHRIAGTSVFHRWLASAIYIDPTEVDSTVHISGEHRSFKSNDSFFLTFDLGTDENLTYTPTIQESLDISDDPSAAAAHSHDSLVDDGEDHDSVWLHANSDRVLMWIDFNLDDPFFIVDATKRLKLKRSKDLYALLRKQGYKFITTPRNGKRCQQASHTQ